MTFISSLPSYITPISHRNVLFLSMYIICVLCCVVLYCVNTRKANDFVLFNFTFCRAYNWFYTNKNYSFKIVILLLRWSYFLNVIRSFFFRDKYIFVYVVHSFFFGHHNNALRENALKWNLKRLRIISFLQCSNDIQKKSAWFIFHSWIKPKNEKKKKKSFDLDGGDVYVPLYIWAKSMTTHNE